MTARSRSIRLTAIAAAALAAAIGAAILITVMTFPDGTQKISFDHEINTTLSKDELWTHLAQAFLDSRDGELWPNGLETIRSEGLKNGVKLEVTYKVFYVFRTTLHYQVTHFHQGETFTYHPVDGHPFGGTATVDLLSGEGGGSALRWKGEYAYTGFSIAALYFRWFEDRFFARLEKNIRKLESRPPKD